MWSLVLFIVTFITIYMTHWIYRWTHPKCKGVLPPGSSGFPLIGETLQMIIPSKSLELSPFYKKRLQRYGPLFRTNFAGQHLIISADAEFNNFIFQQEAKLFDHWYLDSMAKLFEQPESGLSYEIHKYIRGLILSQTGVERLRGKLLNELEEVVRSTVHSWSRQDSVEVKNSATAMFFQAGAKILFSCDPEKSKKFLEKFMSLSKGFMCLPLNIPGTTYHKALKDKKKLLDMLSGVVRDRLASPGKHQDDLLAQILQDMNKEKFITEDFIGHLLFSFLFAFADSVAWTLSVAVKLISENPSVLQELTIEHEELIKKRENPDSPITWTDYKSMTFTHQVVKEVLRVAPLIPGFLRKARKDIEVNGYTIPAGWGIMVATRPVHLNPNTFHDSLKFNPWRWKDLDQDVISKNFMPFGGGRKPCAGADYSMVSLAIFLHVLVTKYRWTKVGEGEIVQRIIAQFRNGLHIKFSEKQKHEVLARRRVSLFHGSMPVGMIKLQVSCCLHM